MIINKQSPYLNYSGINKTKPVCFQQKAEDCTDSASYPSKKEYVVIIDNFENTHGDIIYATAKAINNDPNTVIIKCNHGGSLARNNKFLDGILNDKIINGEKIKAINLSCSLGWASFETLAELTGLPITSKNVHLYKDEVRKFINDIDTEDMSDIDKKRIDILMEESDKVKKVRGKDALRRQPISQRIYGREFEQKMKKFDKDLLDDTPNRKKLSFESFKNEMKLIDSLNDAGIKVFNAAGNEGPDNIDLLAFANCINVGALEYCDIASYSAHHSLVNIYEQGTTFEPNFNELFKGTSYASPKAMIHYANNPEYLELEDPHQIRKDNLIDSKTLKKVRDYKREMSKKHLESFYKPVN